MSKSKPVTADPKGLFAKTIPVGEQLRLIKESLQAEVRLLLPEEQTYADVHLHRYGGIKYVYPNGDLAQYATCKNQLDVSYFTDLDVEALLVFRDWLLQHRDAVEVQKKAIQEHAKNKLSGN